MKSIIFTQILGLVITSFIYIISLMIVSQNYEKKIISLVDWSNKSVIVEEYNLEPDKVTLTVQDYNREFSEFNLVGLYDCKRRIGEK